MGALIGVRLRPDDMDAVQQLQARGWPPRRILERFIDRWVSAGRPDPGAMLAGPGTGAAPADPDREDLIDAGQVIALLIAADEIRLVHPDLAGAMVRAAGDLVAGRPGVRLAVDLKLLGSGRSRLAEVLSRTTA